MKRTLVFIAAAAVAAVPAVIGLAANPSLSHAVPVSVPTQATRSTLLDDRGGESDRDARTEPGDDRDVNGPAVSVPAPTPADAPTSTPPVSPSPAPTVDDNGGLVDRDDRFEPGDDRRLNGTGGAVAPAPTTSGTVDDSSGSGTSGSGTSGSSTSGTDDHGGHGSDDAAGDDHGGGHGSDDGSGDDHGGHGSDD